MRLVYLTSFLFFISCIGENLSEEMSVKNENFEDSITFKSSLNNVELIVLGISQDAGSPQLNCQNDCCQRMRNNQERYLVSSLGLIDRENKATYLFDATPDFTEQSRTLNTKISDDKEHIPDGIFLTHAHIGHYTGLMYLGKEATTSNNVPVYAMPRMKSFLKENGPWNLLVENQNIAIGDLKNEEAMKLANNIHVIPFIVPHRDEYSETVGYKIIGPNKSALFIPDIDKWESWEKDIIAEIKKVDYAFLDATFYNDQELKNRDMSAIPHPFVVETMSLLNNLSITEKGKIYFIHINHSNPLLNEFSDESLSLESSGFHVAREGMVFGL